MRALERQLSDKYKSASSRAICAHLLAMPEYQAAGTIFCFVGTAREIDTRPILEHALAAGKRLCFIGGRNPSRRLRNTGAQFMRMK